MVSSSGYSLEETTFDLACEEAWLNLMSMEDEKKMGMNSVGMKMEECKWNEMEVAMCMGMRTGLHG